jgi:activator of 2-hydroxyglutaryl-CoA dehydratase
MASNQVKAQQQAIANEKAHAESAAGIEEQLVKIRARRQFLEEELKKTTAAISALLRKAEGASVVKKVSELERVKEERERKREAAFERKKKEMGAKPAGVTKVVMPKKSSQKAPVSMLRKNGAEEIGRGLGGVEGGM